MISVSPHTVLVVDDDADVRKSIGRLIELHGYHVLTAKSGPEGLQMLGKDEPIDLVLLDVRMQEMNGYETLAEIKRMGKIDLPVVMLTALSTANAIQNSFQNGASEFLTKPIDEQELFRVLDSHLGGPASEKKEENMD